MNLNSKNVIIFTDGSSLGNPGPGGWGAIIVYNDSEFKVESLKLKVLELGGQEEMTTNNRMELTAAINALRHLESRFSILDSRITIYTDSSYLVNGITNWVGNWQKNGWKTVAKEPVENQDLWESLAELTQNYAEQTRKKIEWNLIVGHGGVVGNERCDKIATAFADGENPKLYIGPMANYPIKNILDIKVDEQKLGKKSEDRKRSRAQAYSYVSMVDGVIKTHQTWVACEKRVKGKSAKFKKALSPEEEKEIVEDFKKLA